ncbi:MAG: DUF4143 domain-containing protein [Candidatus Micrarchaeota archaeon]|nr:DUF4143 domain-containing protein [Candidatus Micrarchaeota archaeon]
MLGNVVNYQTLSDISGLSYKEVRKLLPLLEDSYVLSLVRPFYKNLLNELRKNPKIYFIDYGLRNLMADNFENPFFDALYENFIYNMLMQKFDVKYWRTAAKTEVDFVVLSENDSIPVEVKTTPKITRSFRSFISHYKPKKAFIANLNVVDIKKIDDIDVIMAPFVYFIN